MTMLEVPYVNTATPPDGLVQLSAKSCPVCERASFDEHYVFTRAVIDTSAFKRKLLSLPKTMWDDENQDGNVFLVRPAHDAWGIKKIIFTFCDDFLQKVFDLPWSQKDEWREHLLPVYQALGIDESRVVRCLLASMPPGMTIPVHHDTGYWVKKTHRMHVAIITSEDVDFLSGPTENRLTKYVLDEGRIIELNNQSKHAVVNRAASLWRVHLIFDYVDEDYPMPKRILLAPGEKVNQTRRSLDLARERGTRPLPSFIILGSQKCGTTSLYEYISYHPLVIKGKRRESHFFDWRWNAALKTPEQQLEYYSNFFFFKERLHKYPSLVTGESTPSYLFHSDIVIPRLRAVCPWARLLVILRNPVDRAYSQYHMCIDPEGTPEQLQVRGMSSYIGKSFEDIVVAEIQELKDAGITADSTAAQFNAAITSRRPMTHGGHSIVARGLYALQLEAWMSAFSKEQLKVLLISDIKGDKQKIQRTMDSVFAHMGLPPHDIDSDDYPAPDISSSSSPPTSALAPSITGSAGGMFEPRNSRKYSPISAEIRQILEAFYSPFNGRLKILLGLPSDTSLEW